MALRLAGEEYSVVQGLDEQGWVRETGALTIGGDVSIGANKLKTTNLLLKEAASTQIDLKNAADNDWKDLRVGHLFPDSLATLNGDDAYTLLEARDNGVGLVEVARLAGGADPKLEIKAGKLTDTLNANGQAINTVGGISFYSTSSSIQNGSLFKMKVTTDAKATPEEGDLKWDGTNHKLQVYNGSAWETVSSS